MPDNPSREQQLHERYERALRELQAKEEFNFALFQFSPVATIIVDREGRVIKSNMARRRAGDRLPNVGDIMYRDYARGHEVDMYGELMECMREDRIGRYPNMRYHQKVLSIVIAPFPRGAIITCQDVTEQKRAEQDRIDLITELRRALDEVEKLRGLLPICANCKNVRDDKGYWNTIEQYLASRTSVDFSHTVCPDCMKKLYPEMWEKIKSKEAVEQS
ncbi:MAG: hypothetical protein GF418_14820 [Chitinivibrionales bacterium]|nr:hypothetical protein [Chitinivibrionales bacterium]MBD3396893.1 hypothetical protein [Chitinivibrionales bacterium]